MVARWKCWWHVPNDSCSKCRSTVIEGFSVTWYDRCSLELLNRQHAPSLLGNFMHSPNRKHTCVLRGTACEEEIWLENVEQDFLDLLSPRYFRRRVPRAGGRAGRSGNKNVFTLIGVASCAHGSCYAECMQVCVRAYQAETGSTPEKNEYEYQNEPNSNNRIFEYQKYRIIE